MKHWKRIFTIRKSMMVREKTSDHQESYWKSCCSYISQRWLFTALASIGLCIQNSFSVIMSITIIEMIVQSEGTGEHNNESCHSASNVNSTNQTFAAYYQEDNVSIKRYPWDEYTQGIILSSFTWSSAVVQFFHGSAAERFGGKHILGFGILTQAALTFVIPFVVDRGGSRALIIARFLTGLGSDGMFAVVSTMIPHWSTPEERTRIANIIYSGSVLGLFFGNVIPVLIINYSGMGWPAVFYAFGIFGMVWFAFWFLLIYEIPAVHPFISDKELNYLKSAVDVQKSKIKLPAAPWRHILLCREFWAFAISYIGVNWPYYLMLSDLPKYMGDVVKIPLEQNGYFSALPYLLMWLFTVLSDCISDKIVEKQWMSVTNARKLLASISTVGPCIFLMLASYAECDKTLVVIMFTIGITLIGSFYSSAMMNPLDLSPNYAGSIMSAGSGISSFVAILAPYLVGVLVPNSSFVEWRIVFWMVTVLACCCNGAYLCCFEAKIQPWNEPEAMRNLSAKYKKEIDVEETSINNIFSV